MLWGWEPTTFYQYDGDRLVSSVTESQWDEEQVALLLAEEQITRLTGPNGEWMPEATSDAADPMSYSGWRYVPTGPFTNQAEKARLDALEAHRKELGEDGNLNGVYFGVERMEY